MHGLKKLMSLVFRILDIQVGYEKWYIPGNMWVYYIDMIYGCTKIRYIFIAVFLCNL